MVVSDRYLDSSLAYQGIGRGLGLEKIEEISLWATRNLLPDLTILLDGDPEVLVARRTETPDRMESAGLAFHQAVRQAFLQIAERDRQRIKILDATCGVEELHQQVLSLVSTAFATRAKNQAVPEQTTNGGSLSDLGAREADTPAADSGQAGLQQL